MRALHDPHNVREFVENLPAGTRVIWLANRARGTVQADKAIAWDDGSRMTHAQMNDSHALLIHSEAEWRQLYETLGGAIACPRCGCTLQRWDDRKTGNGRPEKLCPVAVLSDPDASMRRARLPRFAGSVRVAPRVRRPAPV